MKSKEEWQEEIERKMLRGAKMYDILAQNKKGEISINESLQCIDFKLNGYLVQIPIGEEILRWHLGVSREEVNVKLKEKRDFMYKGNMSIKIFPYNTGDCCLCLVKGI